MSQKTNDLEMNPLEVYCRVKPLENETDEECIIIVNDQEIKLFPPANKAFATGTRSEITSKYKRVFQQGENQKIIFDQIGFPLVENLLNGENGLLFAYGVTGSGKTHTISGSSVKPGLIPRTLWVLFYSITGLHLEKGKIIIDHDNSILPKLGGKDYNKDVVFSELSNKDMGWGSHCDSESTPKVDSNYSYSVFISYIEIYNGKVYDLLSSGASSNKQNLKVMKEYNSSKSIFSECEYEFTDANEAYGAYLAGKRKKHQEKTDLNSTSSRGHSIFTIRIVKIYDGNYALTCEKIRDAVITQLSICDLAGSERVRRTNNDGARLKESGIINSSLMALHNCMSVLRKNQKIKKGLSKSQLKIVPYRENIITSIFKNYFEGYGNIKMLVCLSTMSDEYEENIHVMKFSESSQEVFVKKTPQPKFNSTAQSFITSSQLKNKVLEFEVVKTHRDLPVCPPYLLKTPKDNILQKYGKYVEECYGYFEPTRQKLLETLLILKKELRNELNKFNQMDKTTLSYKSQIDYLTASLKSVKNDLETYKERMNSNDGDLESLRKQLEREKQQSHYYMTENKRLKCDLEKVEIEMKQKYEKLFHDQVKRYAQSMVGNVEKIRQIRDITSNNEGLKNNRINKENNPNFK